MPGCYRSHFQTAKHCFPCKYRSIPTCTKNPYPQKTIWWHFMNVFLRGGRGSWGRGRFKVSLFGKSYETKYCVCRLVIWHDVWRHVGLSDAKNSNEKGTESKNLFKFYCFFAMFWFLHFCFVCTWFFEDNFCNSWWILVLFFAFCLVNTNLITVPSKTLVSVNLQELFHLKVQFYAIFGVSPLN